MVQPAQNSLSSLGKKKPITLSSLGVSNVGFGGSKSVSLASTNTASNAATAPASSKTAPAPAPAASQKNVSSPASEEKHVSEEAHSVEANTETSNEPAPPSPGVVDTRRRS